MVVASSDSDTALRRLLVLVLRRRADGTVPGAGVSVGTATLGATLPEPPAKASAGGGGGVETDRRAAGDCRGATRGIAAGCTPPPSSAESSGGGAALATGLLPSTRALRTKGPTTTSSTARISHAVTWCTLT